MYHLTYAENVEAEPRLHTLVDQLVRQTVKPNVTCNQ